MRHGKKFNHLSRKTAHRKAMLANMACSLIEHKRINTTEAKAKALRQYVEPLITKSKNDTTHNRRIVFSNLRNKYAVSELFRDVAVKVGDRPGGYVRIIKLGNRQGDNAAMAMVELVDYNEIYTPKEKKKKSTRRRGRKSGSKATAPAAAPVEEATPSPAEDAAEATAVEAPTTDGPTVEAPVKEAPAAEKPKTEEPKVEEPKAEKTEKKDDADKKNEA
ncbi:MAG: 50S ribosomal protein L17 [Lutimonas sp.]